MFGGRIGSFIRNLGDRIGGLTVHNVLNRIGQVASISHKVGSLVNHTTGGGLTKLANHVLGQGATEAVGKGIGYGARMYDQYLVSKAAMSTAASGTNAGAGGSTAMTQNLRTYR